MLISSSHLSRHELRRLLGMKLELNEINKNFLCTLAREYAGGDADPESAEASPFLVEALFKFGELSLASRVVARRQLDGLQATGFDNLVTNYVTLLQYDFAFPPLSSPRPLYPPAPRAGDRLRVLSFYYATPVYQNNGYAVRTQAILENTTNEVLPFGRIGYPWVAGHLRDNQKSISGQVGQLEYHHRRGEMRNQTDTFANFGIAKDEIRRLITEFRPDVVHAASNFTVGFPALLAAHDCRIPFVYEMRGIWELTAGVGVHGWKESERFVVERKMETLIATHADRVITLTETQKAELVGRGIDDSKVDVVENCYDGDTEPTETTELVGQLRERFSGHTVIGYIGSIVNYEGLQLLIAALARRHPSLEDVRLMIVGDGPYADQLRGVVAASGIAERIHMAGRIPKSAARALYDHVDFCVLPRIDNEVVQLVSPLKLVEILAMGKVLLVSDVDAMAELVRKTGYGEVFRSGDEEDLLAKLVRIRSELPALKAHYARAREHILANHTWTQGARLWDETLRRAVATRSALVSAAPAPVAQDALRSFRPAMTELVIEPIMPLRRLARAKLPPGPCRLRLLMPKAAVGVSGLLVEEGTGRARHALLTSLPAEAEPEGMAQFEIMLAPESASVLMFHVSADGVEAARPASWVLRA